jgi:predicted ATPase
MLHLKSATLHPEKYPSADLYPFNLQIFQNSGTIEFNSPVTFFSGENGTGKSTLLEAITKKCRVHIWKDEERARVKHSPYEGKMYNYLSIEWTKAQVPGSFFGADIFQNFASILDDWAAADPGQLNYFGGKSLLTQSHGQSLMSFFRSRYSIGGLYFLDEPETALSPLTQLELLNILIKYSKNDAQFIIASHSPILLACPEAVIYNFDDSFIKQIKYEDTSHYRIYKSFIEDRNKYLYNKD